MTKFSAWQILVAIYFTVMNSLVVALKPWEVVKCKKSRLMEDVTSFSKKIGGIDDNFNYVSPDPWKSKF